MKKIHNKLDLQRALENREESIKVENPNLSKLLILVYRMQFGFIPSSVLQRICPQHCCKVAVGEGVVIDIDDKLAKEVLNLHDNLEQSKIELDVAQVQNTQINLYYGK